jgi:hypothetical protein
MTGRIAESSAASPPASTALVKPTQFPLRYCLRFTATKQREAFFTWFVSAPFDVASS